MKTIRVFISSTFRDMHAERDFLVKYIFPELRERCLKKGLLLVDVDLRWGVTEEEAEQGKALELCLDEIENCRPFFIGIIGERYGWVPPGYQVPDYPQYDWLKSFEQGHSITALEIFHGVLHHREMHHRAFFYFRDPSFIHQVPDARRGDVDAEDEDSAQKLKLLKDQICQTFHSTPHHLTMDYPCHYAGLRIQWKQVKAGLQENLAEEDLAAIENALGQDNLVDNESYRQLSPGQQAVVDRYGLVYLGGLEDFGQRVLHDLWSAIEMEFPQHELDISALEQEKSAHDLFLRQRTHLFVGREKILQELAECLDDQSGQKPLIVTGEPGSGKSALVARAVSEYRKRHPEALTVIRFVGATPSSEDVYKLLGSVVQEIAGFLGWEVPQHKLEDADELDAYFMELLRRAGEKMPVLVAIDGVNQFHPVHDPHLLTWLPKKLPAGARVLLSTLDGVYTRNAARFELPCIHADSFEKHECQALVTRKLKEYRKALSSQKMQALLQKRESVRPLFLAVACEELRVYPVFEQIQRRIHQLPHTIQALFDQVLQRLEEDHDRGLVTEVLSLLECSMYGLHEHELLEMLGEEDQQHLPQNTWARFFRAISPYMSHAGDTREGLISFFHQQFSSAVRKRYLSTQKHRKACYQQLALYANQLFKKQPGVITNTLQYAGIYIYLAGDHRNLRQLLESFFPKKPYDDSYEIIFEELFDYVVFHFAFEKEKLLKKVIQELSPGLHFAAFLNSRANLYKSMGYSRWALWLFETDMQIVEQLVIAHPGERQYLLMLETRLEDIALMYKVVGKSGASLQYLERREKLLEKLLHDNASDVELRVSLASTYQLMGNYCASRAQSQASLGYYEKQKQLLDAVKDAVEGQTRITVYVNLSVCLNEMADVYKLTGHSEQARRHLEYACDIVKVLLDESPGHLDLLYALSDVYHSLSALHKATGNGAEGVKYKLLEIQIMEDLVHLAPDRTGYVNGLGVCYGDLAEMYDTNGQHLQAQQFRDRALRIMRELVEQDPYRTDYLVNFSTHLSFQGDYYLKNGRATDALESYREQTNIVESLIRLEPEHERFHRAHFTALVSMAGIYKSHDQAAEALHAYEKAARIVQNLMQKDPDNMQYLHDASALYTNMGDFFLVREDYVQAMHFLDTSFALIKKLEAQDPESTHCRYLLACNNLCVGEVFAEQDNYSGAHDHFLQAMTAMDHLLKQEPERTDYLYRQALVCGELGELYHDLDDPAKGMEYLLRGNDLLQRLIQLDAGDVNVLSKLMVSNFRISQRYKGKEDHRRTRELYLRQKSGLENWLEQKPEVVDHKQYLWFVYLCLVYVHNGLEEYSQSIAYARKALNISETDGLLEEYAIALHEQGEYGQAMEVFSRLHQLKPDDLEKLFYLARACFFIRDMDKAGQWLDQCLESNTDSEAWWVLNAWYYRGLIYKQEEAWEKAMECLLNALQTKDDSAAVHYQLGDIYLEVDDVVNACHHLGQAVHLEADDQEYLEAYAWALTLDDDCPKASEIYERLWSLAGTSLQTHVYYLWGRCLYFAGDHGRAQEVLRQYLERDSENEQGSVADAYYFLGMTAREADDYDAALEAWEQAVEVEDQHAGAWAQLADLHHTHGDYKTAELHAMQALESDPDNVSYKMTLLAICYEADKLDTALFVADEILQQEPEHVEALQYKGVILEQTGQPDEALAILEPLDEQDGTDWMGWFSLSEIYTDKQQYPHALIYLDRLTETYDDVELYWNNKAYCLKKSGQYHQAIECADKVLALNPKHKNAAFHKAECLHALGQTEQALVWIKKAKQWGHARAGQLLQQWKQE